MKNPADTRKPYSGLSRSLVIAIDVGTTFSGVCTTTTLQPSLLNAFFLGILCHPGTRRNPKNSRSYSVRPTPAKTKKKSYLTDVLYRFPGQEHVAGNSKIPSIIYYDKHGSIMAAGAEADSSSVIAQAEDEGWIKVEL